MDYDFGCNNCYFVNNNFSSDDYLYTIVYNVVNTEITLFYFISYILYFLYILHFTFSYTF